MHYLKIDKSEIEKLREFENPSKWQDWRELNKKCRYVLQRMIVDKPGGHGIVMEIAKEASHNLGRCRWCDHAPVGSTLDMAQEVIYGQQSVAVYKDD